MNSQNKRKERDLMKLMMSNYEVNLADENNPNDLYVVFMGPKDSPYEGVFYFNFREHGKFTFCCLKPTHTNLLQ
jgi:ubiquitin-protein ligase